MMNRGAVRLLACAGTLLVGGSGCRTSPRASALPAIAIVSAPAPGEITGVVLASATGRGLAGAQVSLEGTHAGALTDSAGRFRLPVVRAGSYSLLVVKLAHRVRRLPIELPVGRGLAIVVSIEPNTIRLDGPAQVGPARTRADSTMSGPPNVALQLASE